MKGSTFLFCFVTLLVACSKRDRIIITESEESNQIRQSVEELTFDLKLKTKSGRFIANELLDSVAIYINGDYWRTTSSTRREVDGLERTAEDSLYTTNSEFSYLILVDAGEAGQFNTAGEYADLLNDNLRIYGGSYSMEIRTIQFRDVDSNLVSFSTSLFTDFDVVQDARSVYVGSYEILL